MLELDSKYNDDDLEDDDLINDGPIFTVYSHYDNDAQEMTLTKCIAAKIIVFKSSSKRHAIDESNYKKAHLSIGFPHLLMTVIIATLNGTAGVQDQADVISRVAFVIGMCATVISAILIFFKIQQRVSKHNVSSGQYSELSKDIQLFLDKRHTYDDLRDLVSGVKEAEKFINSCEPNCGSVCLCGCFLGKVIKQDLPLRDPHNASTMFENILLTHMHNHNYKAKNHKQYELFYERVSIVLNLIHFTFTLTVTVLNSLLATESDKGTLEWVLLGMGIAATLLSGLMGIFKFQETADKHHTASGQFLDICKDTQAYLLLGPYSANKLEAQLELITEKEKFIDSYKPNYSYCLSQPGKN